MRLLIAIALLATISVCCANARYWAKRHLPSASGEVLAEERSIIPDKAKIDDQEVAVERPSHADFPKTELKNNRKQRCFWWFWGYDYEPPYYAPVVPPYYRCGGLETDVTSPKPDI